MPWIVNRSNAALGTASSLVDDYKLCRAAGGLVFADASDLAGTLRLLGHWSTAPTGFQVTASTDTARQLLRNSLLCVIARIPANRRGWQAGAVALQQTLLSTDSSRGRLTEIREEVVGYRQTAGWVGRNENALLCQAADKAVAAVDTAHVPWEQVEQLRQLLPALGRVLRRMESASREAKLLRLRHPGRWSGLVRRPAPTPVIAAIARWFEEYAEAVTIADRSGAEFVFDACGIVATTDALRLVDTWNAAQRAHDDRDAALREWLTDSEVRACIRATLRWLAACGEDCDFPYRHHKCAISEYEHGLITRVETAYTLRRQQLLSQRQ